MSESEKKGLFKRWFSGERPAPAAPDSPAPEPEATPPEDEPAPESEQTPETTADSPPGDPVATSDAPAPAPPPIPSVAADAVASAPTTQPDPSEPGAPAPLVAEPGLRPEPATPRPGLTDPTAEPGPPAARDAVEPPAAPPAAAGEPAKQGWFGKLRAGLSRSSTAISGGITGIFTKRKLDDATLEELEDVLIQADLGIDAASRITERLAASRYDKEISPDEVRTVLAEEVTSVLEPVARPLVIDPARKPHVVLTVGVNGSGKTTTIGKLAARERAAGRSVMLAAGDTFRAAAIEQLKVWGERVGAPVVARDLGADAAGLAFDALSQAREAGTDVLFIDTAGRLQNKAALMAELEKVVRVLKKQDESAPHSVLLVLDATTGQNAVSQVETFARTAGVTGLVMTKLDGTARGGILVAIAEKFALPVHAIGVGEGIDDLQPFDAAQFARAIAATG